MQLKHVHLKSCDSTQDYLRENFTDHPMLISTDMQINGHGTRGRSWSSFENALYFSFSIDPTQTISLTAIEMTLLIRQFFLLKHNIKLLLKWPNDLLNSNKEKVGGILLQSLAPNLFAAGVGINLFPGNEQIDSLLFKTRPGHLSTNNSFGNDFKANYPSEIVNFILQNRLDTKTIITQWQSHCSHLNQMVSIDDDTKCYKGTFVGIGPQGEAQLEIDNKIIILYSGSLTHL